jgi:hypothetical protein
MVWADQILPRQDAVRSISTAAEDGHQVEVHLTQPAGAPGVVIYARAVPPIVLDDQEEELRRFPTVPELVSACDELLAPGALMSLGFVTVPPDSRPAPAFGAEAGLMLSQMAQAELPGELSKSAGGLVFS